MGRLWPNREAPRLLCGSGLGRLCIFYAAFEKWFGSVLADDPSWHESQAMARTSPPKCERGRQSGLSN
jgi:hypothetical protein